MPSKRRSTIVYAEDDPADQLLVRNAFERAGISDSLQLVASGNELLAYLRGEGRYGNRVKFPMADLVITDLEMAGMDGRKAIGLLKDTPALRHLPIVVMTASSDEADVYLAYEWGAASFITKPATVAEWSSTLKTIADYWLNIVTKPTDF